MNTTQVSLATAQGIRWDVAVGGALLAEIAQIIAAILWVAVYSYVMNPGQPMAVYEQYAQASGPWVSIIAGFPIFYYASRWLAKSVVTGLALFGIFMTLDLILLFAMGDGQAARAILWLIVLSYATKLIACYLGGLHGGRTPVKATE